MHHTSTESLKRKFQDLERTKNPTGDPNMLPHICKAKHIYYRIVLAIDRSTGGSDDGGDLNNVRDGDFGEDEEDDDEEGEMVEINNNPFSLSADREQLTVDNDDGGQLDVVAAAASRRQDFDGNHPSVLALLAWKQRVGKVSTSKEMRDGGQKQKKSRAFSMPFETARKKSSCHTDDSNEE